MRRLVKGRAGLLAAVSLLGPLGLLGLARAQYVYSTVRLAGTAAQVIDLYGAEYASAGTLARLATVSEAGGVAYVSGPGHTLLLPIDEDVQRATTASSTVQLDTQRLKAPTATRQGGKLLIPLSTLASGLGAQYTPGTGGAPGTFALPAPALSSVSSLPGRLSDRIVLGLSRQVSVRDRLQGGVLQLTLLGASGSTRNYTTRGAFAPQVQVNAGTDGAQVSLPLPPGAGYRVYTVPGGSGAQVVLDIGPGIPLQLPAILAQVRRPLVVLDPVSLPGRRDVTLEVARSAAQRLSQAGWQVRLTRDGADAASLQARQALARQSDVFVSLDLGRFPGSPRSGVTLYEFSGEAPAAIINAYRAAQGAGLEAQVVSDLSRSRTLSNLLRGELKQDGLDAQQQPEPRLLLLGEAPKAALLLELGWTQSAADQQRLSSAAQTTQMAGALARAVATYLTARANGGGGSS